MEIIDIDLPEEEEEFERDEIFASLETIEHVFDLPIPISGKITKVNEKVLEDLDLLNEDPYEDGWLVEVEMNNPSELDDLLPPEDYELRFLEDMEEIGREVFGGGRRVMLACIFPGQGSQYIGMGKDFLSVMIT